MSSNSNVYKTFINSGIANLQFANAFKTLSYCAKIEWGDGNNCISNFEGDKDE